MQGQAPARDEILKAAEPPLVFCPLGFERRAFLRFGKLPVVTTGPGAAAVRAAFAARDSWPVKHPRLVILLGLAGALNEGLANGFAAAIGSVAAGDERAALVATAKDSELTVVESAKVIASATAKAELRARTHADLVDTESRAFAECAIAAGIPWAIVRGVSDDARSALPAEIAGFVDSRGETSVFRVMAAIARRPTLVGELIKLGRASRTAMRNASFTADALGCLDAIDLCTPEFPLVLYGGSFDPPHTRHATMLADAMRLLRAPCAMVMPAAINPLKTSTPPASPEARLAMCRANFAAGTADFPSEVRLSRLELERAGPSYTIDTLETLVAQRPRLRGAIRLLVGSDAICSIERWHRWREVLTLAKPAVVVRPPDVREDIARFLADFGKANGFADAGSWLLPLDPVELSSTDARTAIARGERAAGLGDGVWREITERRLYGFGGAR